MSPTVLSVFGGIVRVPNVSGAIYALPMIIDCDKCVMKEIACGECVVAAFLAPVIEFAPEVSQSTVEALEVLSSHGLVRPLHFKRAGQA